MHDFEYYFGEDEFENSTEKGLEIFKKTKNNPKVMKFLRRKMLELENENL